MDTADRIEVAYESNTSDHLDLAQGIMAQRKSIVKGRKRKNLRYSATVRRIYVRAGVFAALSILLAAMMCINIAVGVRIRPFHIVVLTLEAGYTLFLLWCALTLHSQQRNSCGAMRSRIRAAGWSSTAMASRTPRRTAEACACRGRSTSCA